MRASRQAHNRGFTLIELLISMSILAMLIGLASYSMMHFSSFWERKVSNIDETRQQGVLLNQLTDVIISNYPQQVKLSSGNTGYYFLGREEGATFVSISPIFTGDGTPAVVRIFREKSETGWKLVYEEAPLHQRPLVYLTQDLNFQYRVVILSELEQLRFNYCGFNERYSDGIDFSSRTFSCMDEYDAVETGISPSRIEITVGNEQTLRFTLVNAENISESRGLDL